MNYKKQILILISSILIIFLITISITYAYFTANLTGTEETTTITVTGGVMNIYFYGGTSINIANIIPADNPAAIKNFTVTGNNTTDIEMRYKINLAIEQNTFSEDALKYKLISTNTDNNGQTVPSINDLTNIGTGSKIIELGTGYFEVPTNGNKVHSYNLEIYFPNADYNQNMDQEKQIKAHVKIEEVPAILPVLLTDAIFNQYGGINTITNASIALFDEMSTETENAMYKIEDDYGDSYYYRGAKDYINNNLIFAEHQWKIVRINGDGSIRLIYNGTCLNNDCTINNNGTSTEMGKSVFNSRRTDAKYVGYMYGGTETSKSTSRIQATTNTLNSDIKTFLDTWYENNILNTNYETYISDTLFCNDRQLRSEVGGAATGTGFGDSFTYYAGYYRLATNKIPNIKCGLKNDRFTVNDTTIGNGALTYPIGLLTGDETSIIGFKRYTSNSSNYLYNNQNWWTMTPEELLYTESLGSQAYAYNITTTGNLFGNFVTYSYGVRGSINLKTDTKVIGTGTLVNPFKVI